MGIALVYFLESKQIIPRLENQLADDAVMFAGIARTQPQIFRDAQLATSLIEEFEFQTSTRVMLLDPRGILMASSDPNDNYRLNRVLDVDGVAKARQGTTTKRTYFSSGLQGEIVDVFTPVVDDAGNLIGIVRLSYRYSTVEEELMSLRYLIVGIIILGAISSAILGFLLAWNIGHPIQQVTLSVLDLVGGNRTEPLPEQGPSEIKILQQAVNFLVERLNELRQNRRQLLANLVHELGRPLGSLHMGIQVLRKGAKDDPQILDELLDGMETETRILRRLLEDLSHLHDELIGIRELEIQTVALSQWLSGVLISTQEVAHRKGLNWVTDIPEGLPEIKLDPQRMAQVIGNLTTNAIKYTPRGGTVKVSAGDNGEMIWIQVSDTGPGIPVDEQELIFEPFYRGTQRQRIKQGMGLGLHIARNYVSAHHGRLEVNSARGSGSTFTVWLPKFLDQDGLSSYDRALAA